MPLEDNEEQDHSFAPELASDQPGRQRPKTVSNRKKSVWGNGVKVHVDEINRPQKQKKTTIEKAKKKTSPKTDCVLDKRKILDVNSSAPHRVVCWHGTLLQIFRNINLDSSFVSTYSHVKRN